MRRDHLLPFLTMRARRVLVAGLIAAALSSAVFAAAANLGVTTDTLGAGGTSVSTCDSAFTSTYVVESSDDSAFKVTGVTVGDIASACVGGRLQVTVIDSTNASLGTGQVTVPDSSSVTVPISPGADPALVVGVQIAVVGGV